MTVKEIYERFKIPQILRNHQLRTAKIAAFIKDHWAGPAVDWDNLLKAALLHDLGNVVRMKADSGINLPGEEDIQSVPQMEATFLKINLD